VITLDRIAERDRELKLIEKILEHRNFNEQVKEWKELGIVDSSFKKSKIIENDLTGKHLSKEYKHLPVDTRYFKDLELEILGLFDDLDNSLDGWLIKSENYQALNTILPKFKEKVQTIYIDPPFNKEQDADYFYSVKYKDSSWITLLENRLRLARDILKNTGSIFTRCDYNGNMYVRLLMNEVFGSENFLHQISINRRKFQMLGGKTFSNRIENLIFFAKSEKLLFNKIRRVKKNAEWKLLLHLPGSRENPERYIGGKKILPPKGRHFGISQAALDIAYKEGRIRFNNKGQPEIFVDTEELNDNWTDIEGYSFGWDFSTENAEVLLKRCIEITSNKRSLILDFFLGSGTTTAVAHKLKRKWIGVEMGEHFYTVILPRMKKVLFYDKSGISKEKDVKEKYNEKTAGGFFKLLRT
jgi:adenine specific DNA methylase Mod